MLDDPIEYQIRPLTSADEPILWEMLYEAVQISGGENVSRDVLRQPELARYVEHWGREGDVGFVAYDANREQALGAVWCRPFMTEAKDGSSELAFAVRSTHRRHGIGAALLTQWVRANPQQSAIRLRVARNNPAVRLYERFGFKVTDESDGVVTMRRDV
ncbi:MAG: N-acetyltransferase family protein [Chthoniobacterales bacterium]